MSENQDKVFSKTSINWYPGHMAKAKRELKEMISLIDIVYEVIDARMPISSKIVNIDDIIKAKPRIMVVTKYDMCDKNRTDLLLNEHYSDYEIVKCDLLKKSGIDNLLNATKKIASIINSDRKNKGLKPRKIRALVIGVPNVGKSTLINRLVGKNAVNVGNIPGVTKSLSWIRINDDIELLDSPGILWPKLENVTSAYNLASLSAIKEEILDTSDLARYIVEKLKSTYPSKLRDRYGIDNLDSESIFEDIAKKRGMYLKGGLLDLEKVYVTIIKDLKDGKFGNVTFD